MKILMVTSEANPLCKTGGLADVVYSLSKSLARKEEVSIFLPFYTQIVSPQWKDKMIKIDDFETKVSWRAQHSEIYYLQIESVNYYLLKNDQYFSRDKLYGFEDDTERFAFFVLACKQFLERYENIFEIIHLHDWQPGMLPLLLKRSNNPKFSNLKYVLTIHNPAFRGYFDSYFLGDFYGIDDNSYRDGTIRLNNMVSTLKAAIMCVDKITTVSSTHANELLNDTNSQGLNNCLELRKDDFIGILNGIDYKEFSPNFDSKIAYKFNQKNFKNKKLLNKEALLKEKDLVVDNAPLFGMVSRLTWQKGLDILIPNIRYLLEKGHKVIILGSGEYKYEQQLEALQSQFPHHLSICIGYNDTLAHKIYAASDFFLMPSLFEPCGLSQMISLKYATVPIVRLIGGLKDTIIPYMNGNIEVANGFGFYNYTNEALKSTLDWCLNVYDEHPDEFTALQVNALKAQNNWHNSSNKYLKVYKQLVKKF